MNKCEKVKFAGWVACDTKGCKNTAILKCVTHEKFMCLDCEKECGKWHLH